MISRKTAWALLAVLAIAVAVLVNPLHSQNSPTWIGSDLTVGKTAIFSAVPGDRKLSMIQVVESSSWVGSFYGRNYAGVWTRISPMYGAAATDTSLASNGTTPFFTFPGIKLEVIVTTSGTATFWGE